MLSTLKTKRKGKKGFTLVELVIVIAIIAILSAIAIPTVNNVIDTANESTDKANAQTVELTLKTADAEITAKTITFEKDDPTVKEVLEKYGVDIAVSKEGKSGEDFTYDEDSRVYCEKDAPGKKFEKDTKLSEVIEHSDENDK